MLPEVSITKMMYSLSTVMPPMVLSVRSKPRPSSRSISSDSDCLARANLSRCCSWRSACSALAATRASMAASPRSASARRASSRISRRSSSDIWRVSVLVCPWMSRSDSCFWFTAPSMSASGGSSTTGSTIFTIISNRMIAPKPQHTTSRNDRPTSSSRRRRITASPPRGPCRCRRCGPRAPSSRRKPADRPRGAAGWG